MALGKIKADTLEHSTAGSLDTSYVVNGSAKAWCETSPDGTSILGAGGFGFSSITDAASGQQQMHLSNAMSDTFYSRLATLENSSAQASWTDAATTTSFYHYSFNGASYVDSGVCYGILGDLA